MRLPWTNMLLIVLSLVVDYYVKELSTHTHRTSNYMDRALHPGSTATLLPGVGHASERGYDEQASFS